jgi:hypothetical protein
MTPDHSGHFSATFDVELPGNLLSGPSSGFCVSTKYPFCTIHDTKADIERQYDMHKAEERESMQDEAIKSTPERAFYLR